MKRKPEPEQPKAADTRTVLMRWRCPICGIHTCGFVTPEDSGIRYCHGTPNRPHTAGEICGGNMLVVHREFMSVTNSASQWRQG